jgi:endonuclease/exonuclease/phosphatase family metal-dependent hydrolase
MVAVRVMTYNIFEGGRFEAPLREVVRAAAPDVLVVNELPPYPFVWRRRCRRLAEDWGMELVLGGRRTGSVGLLVRPGVAATPFHHEVLGRPPCRTWRGIVSAQLRVEGRLMGVVGCHLSPDHEGLRVRETAKVLRVAETLPGPVVVAGDLNERPDGPDWATLRKAGFADHGSGAWLTFPARAPVKRIDAVLVRGDARVRHHGDPGVDPALLAAASDHRPVLAVLDL